MSKRRILCLCCHAAPANLSFEGVPVCAYCHPDGVVELARLDGHPGCKSCDRAIAEIAAATRARFVLRDTAGEIDPDLDLGEFYALNDMDAETVNAIGRLTVGESVTIGGGAAETFTVLRVA